MWGILCCCDPAMELVPKPVRRPQAYIPQICGGLARRGNGRHVGGWAEFWNEGERFIHASNMGGNDHVPPGFMLCDTAFPFWNARVGNLRAILEADATMNMDSSPCRHCNRLLMIFQHRLRNDAPVAEIRVQVKIG